MSRVQERDVIRTIRKVVDPDSGKDLISLGRVKDLTLSNGEVSFKVLVDPQKPLSETVLKQIKSELESLEGVEKAAISLEQKAGTAAGPARRPEPPEEIPGVKRIIAVASGKGGVGKSTVAVNLAVALAREARVGLLDGDIYGPSVPTMLGAQGARPKVQEKRIFPIERYGVHLMSLGFLVEGDDTPLVWRGPMVHSALRQFLHDVEWGELDWLVVDLPPGTGDAHLTLTQGVPLDGAIIVTTPQEIALTDARKGLKMFEKVGAPVLGIVENMGTFVCPDCGGEHALFGEGGGRATAERYGVPFLGTIPLHPDVTPTGDRGHPIVAAHPESAIAERFREIAHRVIERVG